MRSAPLLLGALGALSAYPFAEARWYRVKHLDVPAGPDVPRVSILHVSDLHMSRGDARLQRFLRGLNDTIRPRPDIVVATGDLLQDNASIAPVIDVLGGLFPDAARFYVLGSHDYYQARFQSYVKYFVARARGPLAAPRAETGSLEAGLQEAGWVAVTNRSVVRDTAVGRVQVAGVDDPYLGRHSTGHIGRERDCDIALGLVHSPDVVSDWLLGGFDVVFAGHTHAGQVRIPGIGAVVTNCSLPNALAGGLHRIGNGWLHVSPGLGTGKFTPIRFNCRPEATVLTLTP